MVAEQLQNVRAEIRKACEKSGRNPEEVTLIAVSKTKPISMIREAMDCLLYTSGRTVQIRSGCFLIRQFILAFQDHLYPGWIKRSVPLHLFQSSRRH